jgi:hypothetical protein
MNLLKLILLALLIPISAHAQDCLSNLPASLKSTLEQDNWKIVQPGDIPMDDWKLWKNAHQGQCPGVAPGNFASKDDFAVALIQQDDQKKILEKLILVTQKKGQPITEVVVPPTQVTNAAVVWKLPQATTPESTEPKPASPETPSSTRRSLPQQSSSTTKAATSTPS